MVPRFRDLSPRHATKRHILTVVLTVKSEPCRKKFGGISNLHGAEIIEWE